MKTLELDVTFSRDYFTRHFGIVFGEGYFDDVRARAETDRRVAQSLHERFGEYGFGDPDPQPVVQLGYDDTLNITLAFGGEVHVRDGVSWTSTGFVHEDSVDGIKVPDIASSWPHTNFLSQYEETVRLFGKDTIRPPKPHGILESALEMRGGEFLEDLILEPARACHLLDVLTDTTIAMKEYWDRVCYGEVRKEIALGGCSTVMLSSEQVREFLVPRYNKIASRFARGFLCSCGLSTHNLENFAAVKDAYFVRCGWGSDFAKAAQVLKDRHLKAGLDIGRVASQSPEELDRDVRAILDDIEELDNASLLLIHASADTPDASVRQLVSTVRDWTANHGTALVQNW